ncbi:MAG: aminopeptidase P family protein [Leptolyngbyaceae bacterium]|nr:aminopeptidase P family protein [Leptolyngbyaceae bacterium]
MSPSSPGPTLIPIASPSLEVLKQRRQRLSDVFTDPVLLWSGNASARNFPANVYPFRANSHFLYFVGYPLQNAVVYLEGGRLTLYMDNPSAASALWHGPEPEREAIAHHIGASAAFPLADLPLRAQDAATVLAQDGPTQQHQGSVLGRSVVAAPQAEGLDRELAIAISQIRLCHDAAGLEEMRHAAAVTVKAHQAGMRATPTASHESDVRAAMERVILAQNMTTAYSSIVTVQGEVLHNNHYHHRLSPGDLLLADVGAETASGWAADITRTWPVSGTFSPSQRSLYAIVLAAHDACIAEIKPGVEYREIHLLAAQIMAEGLVDLGILRGNPMDLVEQDAHALFFPHGVGHLLGLDVHDMEDLGDMAGYAPGRQRSDRFGLSYLRLDRPLQPNMVVTIEPGFYQVPGILQNPDWRSRYQTLVNWDRLAEFADVRGIRIEDDVRVTETGHEVLTAALPTAIADIEALMNG